MVGHLSIIFLLTVVNGFFSMSEIAFVSMNENKVKAKATEGDKKSQLILRLLQNSTRFLSTIQVAITLAGFLSSAFAADAFASQLATLLHQSFPNLSLGLVRPIAMIGVTLILSYFTLVFGELVPKRIGMNQAEKVAYAVVRAIFFTSILLRPIVALLSFSTNLVVSLFGISKNDQPEEVTEEEIKLLIDVGEEKGTIMQTEKKLINNIFNFNNTPVSDIMTHRVDMETCDIEEVDQQQLTDLLKGTYTRIPFYKGSVDNIVGILYIKDLFKQEDPYHLSKQQLVQMLRKPTYVPQSLECDELFFQMQREKVHMAIVIDEYGGTAGLVTMEDLVEEIVGNIFDEYDLNIDEEIISNEDGSYDVAGTVSLDNVESLIYIDLPLDDYDTLSGFMIGLLGRLPIESDLNRVLEFNGYRFTIQAIKHYVISRVNIALIEKKDESDEY